jgi:hypothetical protein
MLLSISQSLDQALQECGEKCKNEYANAGLA